MNSINKKIEDLSKFNLEDFDIDVLEMMQGEIKQKQEKLSSQINTIKNSIKGANINKQFYGKTKLLPEKFSTPLRRIISKQREIKRIKKYNNRYQEEIFRLNNIIQRKKLDQYQNNKFRYRKFSKLRDGFIAFLILITLGILSIEIFYEGLSKTHLLYFFVLDSVCCLIFQINFFYELYICKNKRWYIRNHWLDFITSIPIPNYELFTSGRLIRLLRLLRVLRILRVLKLFKLISYFWRGMDSLSEILDVKLMKKTAIYSILLLITGAIMINYIEFSSKNGFNNYLESLWWSFNAVVTGGFVDIYNPKTGGGRLLTTVLVIVGMILISVFTATLTTMMVGDDNTNSNDNLKSYFEKRLNNIEGYLDKLNNQKK